MVKTGKKPVKHGFFPVDGEGLHGMDHRKEGGIRTVK
jgi:hypothetical protein